MPTRSNVSAYNEQTVIHVDEDTDVTPEEFKAALELGLSMATVLDQRVTIDTDPETAMRLRLRST